MAVKTRNVDPRLSAARGRAAVTKREVGLGRRTPEELAVVNEDLRRTVVAVNFERATAEMRIEIEAGNLTADTYRSISDLYSQAASVAYRDGLNI